MSTETCEPCHDYLARRRRVLLPHLGRWVCRTGRPPADAVGRIAAGFHAREHQS